MGREGRGPPEPVPSAVPTPKDVGEPQARVSDSVVSESGPGASEMLLPMVPTRAERSRRRGRTEHKDVARVAAEPVSGPVGRSR